MPRPSTSSHDHDACGSPHSARSAQGARTSPAMPRLEKPEPHPTHVGDDRLADQRPRREQHAGDDGQHDTRRRSPAAGGPGGRGRPRRAPSATFVVGGTTSPSTLGREDGHEDGREVHEQHDRAERGPLLRGHEAAASAAPAARRTARSAPAGAVAAAACRSASSRAANPRPMAGRPQPAARRHDDDRGKVDLAHDQADEPPGGGDGRQCGRRGAGARPSPHSGEPTRWPRGRAPARCWCAWGSTTSRWPRGTRPPPTPSTPRSWASGWRRSSPRRRRTTPAGRSTSSTTPAPTG